MHLDSTAEARALMCVLTAELGVCRVEACSLAKESEGWAPGSSGADASPTRGRLWMREMFFLCCGSGWHVEGEAFSVEFPEAAWQRKRCQFLEGPSASLGISPAGSYARNGSTSTRPQSPFPFASSGALGLAQHDRVIGDSSRGPEGRSFTAEPSKRSQPTAKRTQPPTPGASPGVVFFSCRGAAKGNPGRASARRVCTNGGK